MLGRLNLTSSTGSRPKARPFGELVHHSLEQSKANEPTHMKRGPKLEFDEWAQRVPESKTGPLDFERFPYQREWYSEGAELPSIEMMKSTQVGASAFLVRWAIYWPDIHGATALYVFPADTQLRDFYNQRIATLLRGPYLAGRVKHAAVLNIHQQNIGAGPNGKPVGGWLNLRGAQTTASLESVDADVLAIDEYDLIPKESIPVAERRTSGLTSRDLIRRIGWPSVDNYGISKLFNEGDRRRWFVKCPACKTQQFLRFFKRNSSAGDEASDGLPKAHSGYVNIEDATLRCGKCDKVLKKKTVASGEWVAEFPSREERSYHAHRLIVPGAKLKPLIAASTLSDPWQQQSFYNRDLGEPFSLKEGRLSKAAIAAAQSAGGSYSQGPWDVGYQGDGLVTMGVDSASERNLNVRISLHDGRTKRALFIGEVEDSTDCRS